MKNNNERKNKITTEINKVAENIKKNTEADMTDIKYINEAKSIVETDKKLLERLAKEED